MIELIQFPWSPFCLVQKRILEYAQVRFKIINIPINDRSLVWRLTRQRYYQVPILKDGRSVLFETDEHSQVLAKYLDESLHLGLFPADGEGQQSIIWRFFEQEIEGVAFRLNDIYYREFVSQRDQLGFLRHKERRFGRGCLDVWAKQQSELLADLEHRLLPCEEMLVRRPYLLGEQPRFVDFDLYGMLANFLFSGHYALPSKHNRLTEWYARIATITLREVGPTR
jgi:glutathione S-transferase